MADKDDYLLDSNIFGKILSGDISLDELKLVNLFATHIQHDEILQTADEERRNKLRVHFRIVDPKIEPTSSLVWDLSAFDLAKFSGDEGELYNKLLQRIQRLDAEAGKSVPEGNQERDALLGETAIRGSLVLVTTDKNLRRAVTEHRGTAIKFNTFRKRLRI